MAPASGNSVLSHRLVILWLLALLMAGAYLRVHGVSNYYYSLDELAHINMSKGSTIQEIFDYSRFETHPPYPQLLRHWLLAISDSPSLMRGESAFFGLLCMLAYFTLGRQLGGTLAGCACAYLVAFGYGNILQSQVVRNYTLLALFLCMAYYYYQAFLRTGKRSDLAGYAAGTLLALMTHYCAVFALCCMGGMGFVLLCMRKSSRPALYLWVAANAALSLYFCYIYVTEIRMNAYMPLFLLNDKIAKESAEYNNIGFRAALFFAYIPTTVSYYLHASFANPMNIPCMLLFIASMVWMFSVTSLRALFYETLLSLLFGAALLACNMYPNTFRIGGRHAIWALPYVILPIGLFLGKAAEWAKARLPEHWAGDRRLIALGMGGALAFGIAINSSGAFFSDLYEYQMSNAEHRQMEDFLGTFTHEDVIIGVGGLNAMYLMPGNINYYQSLAALKKDDWYYTPPAGTSLRLLLYPPNREGTFKLRDYIKRLDDAGALKEAKEVWFFHTLYSGAFSGFAGCDEIPKTVLAFPKSAEHDLVAAKMKKSSARVEIVGVPYEVLMHDIIPENSKFARCM